MPPGYHAQIAMNYLEVICLLTQYCTNVILNVFFMCFSAKKLIRKKAEIVSINTPRNILHSHSTALRLAVWINCLWNRKVFATVKVTIHRNVRRRGRRISLQRNIAILSSTSNVSLIIRVNRGANQINIIYISHWKSSQ